MDAPEHGKTYSSKVFYYVTKEMSHRPIRVCACMTTLVLALVVISVATGLLALTEPSQYDWVIASSSESKNRDALTEAIEDVDEIESLGGSRNQIYDEKLYFYFHAHDGGELYTLENVQAMCEVESVVAQRDAFKDFCRLQENGECELPSSSIVVYFYDFKSLSDWNCLNISQAQVDSKRNAIYAEMETAEGQAAYGFWLGKESLRNGYSRRAQSIWYFGAPLDGYNSTSSKFDRQKDKYTEFLASTSGGVGGIEKDLFSFFSISTNENGLFPYYPSPYMASADTDGVDVMWHSYYMQENESTRILASDLQFATFSIVFVLIWLRMHTGSIFIALMGMFMIFCSIPVTVLVYKGVFQIPYFSELHSLVIFIILGVGADDVFVLVDSWKQTADMFPGDIKQRRNLPLVHKRLMFCLHHTMSTVFNTSFTTACAFLATGFSPLMPIASFGWFAATCIVLNYVCVISLMPPVVVIADMYFTQWIWELTKSEPVATDDNLVAVTTSSKVDSDQMDSSKPGEEKENGVELVPAPNGKVLLGEEPEGSDNGSVAHSAVAETVAELSKKHNDPVEYFIAFLDTSVVVGKVKIPIVSLVLSVGLLVFGIVSCVYGLLLEPPTSQESWFPDQHMFTLAQDSSTSDFLGFDGASYEDITLTMGIARIDRSEFNVYKPGENRGTPVYDDDWNLALPACQQVFVRMCADIQTFACQSDGCDRTGLLARTNTTECFMVDFRAWADSEHDEDTYNMNASAFYLRLNEFRESQFQKYHPGVLWQDDIGFIDGVLQFGSMPFTSTMESEAPSVLKREVADRIQKFIKKVKGYDECDECDCSSLMYSSPIAFQWMRAEEGIIRGFYQGLAIAFPVAFAVLLFATGNILLALYAITAVFLIVFGVLGFVNYGLNWGLGIAESIAGIIIIGFSVDYTVHLGHMYNHAEIEGGAIARQDKFEFTARKMVGTIVGGAITTAGAGVFMFGCQLIFFIKMATLIVLTILFSYVYSLGFFMSVLYLFGPEGYEGNVLAGYRWCYDMVNNISKKGNEEKQVEMPPAKKNGDVEGN